MSGNIIDTKTQQAETNQPIANENINDILKQLQSENFDKAPNLLNPKNIQPTKPGSNFEFNEAVGKNLIHANDLDRRNVHQDKKSFGLAAALWVLFVTGNMDKKTSSELHSLLSRILQISYDVAVRITGNMR